MAVAAGTKLGPYEVLSPLGAGGMGEVYRARDPRLGRDVAVKVLPAEYSNDPELLRRFEQEARATAALNHPNILALFDIARQDESPYIVSELLEGETLRDRLRGGALPLKRVIDYALQILRGLAAAHDRGIVHRDLKPENIFVTRAGQIKILDFGLAKLTMPESESIDELSAEAHDGSGHMSRRTSGDHGLHVARAVAGTTRRCPRRFVQLWRRALRDAERAAAVSWKNHCGYD